VPVSLLFHVAVLLAGVAGALLRVLTRSRAPARTVLLWPRLDDPAEACEQLWRSHYYLPEFEVLFWLGPAVQTLDCERPPHVGAIEPSAQPRGALRGRTAFFRAFWRICRHGGRLLIWRKPRHVWRELILVVLRRVCGAEIVDRHHNRGSGWLYLGFRARLVGHACDIRSSRDRFFAYLDGLAEHEKSYIFGTGPSLALADNLDFSDGYRIVCNTIVKDPALLRRLRPQFVTACDGIYHFGYSAFACRFRADLARLLADQEDIAFVYPSEFDELVCREFGAYRARCLPIPAAGPGEARWNMNLRAAFCLPPLSNVLSMMLLPLASTLGQTVYLLGFDGRAPADRFFWSYSDRHAYVDLLPSLHEAHPAFFAKVDYKAYMRVQMGDAIERLFAKGEAAGIRYVPMTPSFSAAIARRWRAGWYSERAGAEQPILAEWEQTFLKRRAEAEAAREP